MVSMKRAGFTLIELLVVISILSVLTALTSAASHYAREQAKAAKCKHNIRGLSLDLITYSMDTGRFPKGVEFTLGHTIGDLMYDLPAKWWFQAIGHEPKMYDVSYTPLQCPSKQLSGSISLKYNKLWANYGVNWSVCSSLEEFMPSNFRDFARTSLAYDSAKSPSQLLLMLDSGYSLLGWQLSANPIQVLTPSQGPLATSYIPGLSLNKERELHPIQKDDAEQGRHLDQRVNVGYVDGHVEQRQADSLLVDQSAEGHYSNRTPLWKPR